MVNILNLDTEMLELEYFKFKHMYGYEPRYIIMSNKTLHLLKQQTGLLLTRDLIGNDKVFSMDIAICDALLLGHIDIK